MKARVKKYLDVMTSRDPGNQITLLPCHFSKSIQATHDLKMIADLGVANLCGWLAFRIYDDLLDDEGYPEDIPIANIALREVVFIYTNILPREHLNIFTKTMDAIDQANSWEREACRISLSGTTISYSSLPSYGSYRALADKSIGHALGPVALLIKNAVDRGVKPKAADIENLIAFFRHYIIARQLNDDAHDWYSDLSRGFLNSGSVEVLKIWQKKHSKIKTVDIAESKNELQAIFWDKAILKIARDIDLHISHAEKCISTMKYVNDSTYLESLLSPIREAGKKALSERKRTMDFLAGYTGQTR